MEDGGQCEQGEDRVGRGERSLDNVCGKECGSIENNLLFECGPH